MKKVLEARRKKNRASLLGESRVVENPILRALGESRVGYWYKGHKMMVMASGGLISKVEEP